MQTEISTSDSLQKENIMAMESISGLMEVTIKACLQKARRVGLENGSKTDQIQLLIHMKENTLMITNTDMVSSSGSQATSIKVLISKI